MSALSEAKAEAARYHLAFIRANEACSVREEALSRVEALVTEGEKWRHYDSHDTGEVFSAESVRDLLAALRESLPAPARPEGGSCA